MCVYVQVYHLRYDTLENGVAHRSNVDGSDAQVAQWILYNAFECPAYAHLLCLLFSSEWEGLLVR